MDPAILRRMPRTCHIALPDPTQRRDILRVLLKHESLEASFDYERVAQGCSCDGHACLAAECDCMQ